MCPVNPHSKPPFGDTGACLPVVRLSAAYEILLPVQALAHWAEPVACRIGTIGKGQGASRLFRQGAKPVDVLVPDYDRLAM